MFTTANVSIIFKETKNILPKIILSNTTWDNKLTYSL